MPQLPLADCSRCLFYLTYSHEIQAITHLCMFNLVLVAAYQHDLTEGAELLLLTAANVCYLCSGDDSDSSYDLSLGGDLFYSSM